jgi:hypothetical protein
VPGRRSRAARARARKLATTLTSKKTNRRRTHYKAEISWRSGKDQDILPVAIAPMAASFQGFPFETHVISSA